MKVLIADDNRLMLEGLQTLLEVHDIEVAGKAKDGLEALALARQLMPDVILMDIRMPGLNGLEATRLIKAEMPDARIVILTTSVEDQDLFEAVKSGACGYLLKSMDIEKLVEALRQAQQGIPPFSPGLAMKLLTEFARLNNKLESASSSTVQEESRATQPAGDLTPRQIEVLTLASQGLSYKEIGNKVGLSPHTVRYHMVEIMQALHLRNRAQVLAYAVHLGCKNTLPDK
jgi:DNA-binding NarL/FixJ family response regulator